MTTPIASSTVLGTDPLTPHKKTAVLITTLALGLAGCSDREAATEAQVAATSTAALSTSRYNNAPISYQDRCASCHGGNGQGNRDLGAPTLVNLQPWYIERQLQHFRDGVRGGHADDVAGATMAASVQGLSSDALTQLTNEIGELPKYTPKTTVSGDVALGKDHFSNVCSACHGQNARGNEILHAPALAGVDDWYLLASYEKFRAGIRGAHPDDTYGIQMVRIAPVLADEDLTEAVTAYVASLPIRD